MINSGRNIITRAILVALLLSAVYQGGVGVLQLLGFVPSGNRLYPFTGTFYNPGPFACFLAMILPKAVSFTHFRCKYGYLQSCGVWLAWTVMTLDALLLPASMSRTAWAAGIVGMSIAAIPKLLSLKRLQPATGGLWIKAGVVTASIAVVLTMSVGAYHLKQGSADGRLLMWKVAVSAVSPNPLEGTGWQNVAGTYGEAQERYFASGMASPNEILVADAPEYVFNEYLQIAIAYGWGWSMLMVIILAAAFLSALRSGSYGVAGGVAACAVVMTASYPFQFPISILTIGVICIAAFISGSPCASSFNPIMIVLTIAGIPFLIADCKKFDQNIPFQTGLALHKRGEWMESNKVMTGLLPHSSDPMPLNIIGKNYTELNMRDSAEYYLRRSTLRCPNRLYPHYLLMKLYLREPADSTAARREAKILLSTKEKVPSPAVEEMRKEAVKLIHNAYD